LLAFTAGLTTALNSHGAVRGPVRVLARRPNLLAATSPSEVVTCRVNGGEELRLLCKYAAGRNHDAHGHRGGVGYEAEVYRQVLGRVPAPVPRFFGAPTDAATGERWLVVEYLDGAVGVDAAPERGALGEAARWLGRFHAATQARFASRPPAFLKVYDAEYYRGWARRTVEFAGPLGEHFPWLRALSSRFAALCPVLVGSAPPVIHGECYPANVLFYRGQVYPVDWESAAVGPGEVDLAALTEGWPAEAVRHCEDEYRQARWPGGAPAGWQRTLAAARLYWGFRWLGDRPEWTTHESTRERFDELRAAGERLGLL
jgi:hypothetical protein